jgi:hypothetical protein
LEPSQARPETGSPNGVASVFLVTTLESPD